MRFSERHGVALIVIIHASAYTNIQNDYRVLALDSLTPALRLGYQ